MTDTQNSAVTNQIATDQKFELLTRFLKKHFWVLTSCTIAIVVAVLAVYISNMPSGRSAKVKVGDAVKSLEATLEKRFDQIEHHITDAIKSLEAQIEAAVDRKLDQLRFFTKNCAELYKSGQNVSGVYTINPDGTRAFDVFCDQTTAGGGWTVLQKRLDGSVDFYRGWTDYKNGFGDHEGEFWLGLDKIHRLTKTRSMLRVDLQDTSGETAHAEYDGFAVMSKSTKYQLSLGTYSGTAGDSLSWHHGFPFTTKDQDNDSWGGNCAVTFKGAWWYRDCLQSNLNGVYHHGKHSSYADGVNWHIWKGYHYSAKRAEMKIRPVEF